MTRKNKRRKLRTVNVRLNLNQLKIAKRLMYTVKDNMNIKGASKILAARTYIIKYIKPVYDMRQIKKVIETKIKFDERFFLYMEDLDFCRTVRNKGFKILENKNVMIIHNANRLSRNSFRYVKLHIKSLIKYFLKWGFF